MHRVGIDRDRVGDAVDLRDRRRFRHHGRVDALLDAALAACRDAEQLDAVAELVRRLQVGGGDRLDALDMDRLGVDLGAEGKAGQDGELVGGVEAADVEGRVGLGIAEALRVREAIVEGQALRLHPRQDVVAGAVEDAVDALDRIADEALAQRLDDRDAASDRRLEVQRDAGLSRPGGPDRRHGGPASALLAVTTGLPASSAATTAAMRRAFVAADQLDQDVDGRDLGQRHRIVEPAIAVERDTAVARRSRAETAVTVTARPQAAASALARRSTRRSTEVPTVPRPATPIFRGSSMGDPVEWRGCCATRRACGSSRGGRRRFAPTSHAGARKGKEGLRRRACSPRQDVRHERSNAIAALGSSLPLAGRDTGWGALVGKPGRAFCASPRPSSAAARRCAAVWSAVSKNLRMLRAACRMRCSFSTKAMRT